MTLHPIAHIQCDFPQKFGIPRQSGVIESLKATVIFQPEYRNADALRGLDDFSHLWLIWGFSRSEGTDWSPTVRPPRLGGNARLGVFATRSPYRPNPIGLSSVKIDNIAPHPDWGTVIHVLGADLMNGTPIYDIKPYLPYTDCHPEAIGGFAGEEPQKCLTIVGEEDVLSKVPPETRDALLEVLAYDPRPRYHNDPNRIYGLTYARWNIRFTVEQDRLTVIDIHTII